MRALGHIRKHVLWGLVAAGVAAFAAGIFADGQVSDSDIRAMGVVLVLLSVGAIAYRRLSSPYRRLGEADLVDLVVYVRDDAERDREGLRLPRPLCVDETV